MKEVAPCARVDGPRQRLLIAHARAGPGLVATPPYGSHHLPGARS